MAHFYRVCSISTKSSATCACVHQPVWPDLAKFHHFGNTFKGFGKNCFRVYFKFGKKIEPALAKSGNWAYFQYSKWPNIEQIIKPSGAGPIKIA